MPIYDYSGNVVMVNETDNTLSVEGKPADAAATGEAFARVDEQIGGIVEPMGDDIPTLHFMGPALPTTKEDGKILYEVLYDSRTQTFSEWCTLKVQGDGSVKYPKKNFNIQFFKDSGKAKKSKHNFKGWGSQSKFTLKANWSDITHARNIVNARIWTDIVRKRSNYEQLPVAMLNSPNLAVIDGFLVRVFVNGVYHGRYTFNLPKDPWMFNMDEDLETNFVLYGEGKSQNGSSRFKALAVVDGTDWTDEIHEDDVPQSVIDDINAFIMFVMNSSDAQFMANLDNYVDVESLIDAHLFACVDCGIDSIGKNEIFMKYSPGPYICSVYDLETTWGMRWDGAMQYSPTESWPARRDLSLLHQRLAEQFDPEIRARYTLLRSDPLSVSNIQRRFEEFMRNQSSELIAEDYASTTAGGAYTEIPSKNDNNIQQIRQFVVDRLAYTDSVILA